MIGKDKEVDTELRFQLIKIQMDALRETIRELIPEFPALENKINASENGFEQFIKSFSDEYFEHKGLEHTQTWLAVWSITAYKEALDNIASYDEINLAIEATVQSLKRMILDNPANEIHVYILERMNEEVGND
jgi:hypothetical protein